MTAMCTCTKQTIGSVDTRIRCLSRAEGRQSMWTRGLLPWMRPRIVRPHDCFSFGKFTETSPGLAQFNHFLGELGIKTIPTDMSFGVSTADGSLEWGSYSLRSFIGTISNLFSPWFWRLMFDALRFSLFAIDLCYAPEPPKRPTEVDCEEPDTSPLLRWHTSSVAAVPAMEEEDSETIPFESIGDYITRQGYSRQFLTYYLIPLVAAPWCIDPDEFARSFPAKTLIQFM